MWAGEGTHTKYTLKPMSLYVGPNAYQSHHVVQNLNNGVLVNFTMRDKYVSNTY
jgi:hypothetical protein